MHNADHTLFDSGGMKDEKGKIEWTLVPWEGMKEVAKVLKYGADKYTADNWRKVPPYEYQKSLLRHVIDYQKESLDPESGLPHLAHAICCALFLLELEPPITESDKALKGVMDAIQDFEQGISDMIMPKDVGQLYLDFVSGTYKKKGGPC